MTIRVRRNMVTGYEFTGIDINSPGYRKDHFIQIGMDISTSKYQRKKSWQAKESKIPDEMYDVTATIDATWSIEHYNDPTKAGTRFEVICVERIDGRVKTTILTPNPIQKDVVIDVEEEEVLATDQRVDTDSAE